MSASLTIRLKKREKEALKKLKWKRTGNQAERAQYILLLDEGKTVAEISKLFGRHKHTIRTWIKAYESQGVKGLKNDSPPGRPDQKTSLVISELESLLTADPKEYGYQQSGWQINMLIDYFSQAHKAAISPGTMKRALRKSGWVYKRFSKRVPHESPSKAEKAAHLKKMIADIKKEAKRGDVEIFFEDETHFSNEPYVERGWFRRGEKKRLRRQKSEGVKHALAL